MKFIVAPILMMLMLTQVFSKWFMIFDYKMNQNFIATTLCENKDKPVMQCHGKCQLAKKMKQEERDEQNTPGQAKSKIQVVLSSKSFFATIDGGLILLGNSQNSIFTNAKLTDIASSIFHPPIV